MPCSIAIKTYKSATQEKLNKELNDGYIIGFPLQKGQSAKVTETFSENLTEMNISALKFLIKS